MSRKGSATWGTPLLRKILWYGHPRRPRLDKGWGIQPLG